MITFNGKLYRALNPIHARDPLSGEGARLYGGRFNPKGIPALYLSLSIMTALREANQVGSFQPTTLVCYEADISKVFDCQEENGLTARGMDLATLADSGWREEMRSVGQARTQAFARQLIAEGHQGLLVRSFAPGADALDINLVLWKWSSRRPARLLVIDDEKRLSS